MNEFRFIGVKEGDFIGLLIKAPLYNIYGITLETSPQVFANKKEGGYVAKFHGRLQADDRIEIRGKTFPIQLIKEASKTECDVMVIRRKNGPVSNGCFQGKFIFRHITDDGLITFLVKQPKQDRTIEYNDGADEE